MATRVGSRIVRKRPKDEFGRVSNADLEAFYRSVYRPLVRRATWKHGLALEDARDIVQDAFVLALTRLKSDGNPRAWLIQVVDNLALNYRRRSLRRSQLAHRWGLVGSAERPEDAEGGNSFD